MEESEFTPEMLKDLVQLLDDNSMVDNSGMSDKFIESFYESISEEEKWKNKLLFGKEYPPFHPPRSGNKSTPNKGKKSRAKSKRAKKARKKQR